MPVLSRKTRSVATVRYAVDDNNRLVIREPAGATDRLRPARILDGTLTTDRRNRLVYHVSGAETRDGHPGPQTFTLDGTWRLTPNHELALVLHEAGRRGRQTLYLKGALIKAEANALIVALHRSQDEEVGTIQRLTLSGRWSADAGNRLSFLVEKGDGTEDRLTLQGGWEVGRRHELAYRYRRRDVATRTREEHALVFDGFWDITGADRLVYRLTGSRDSFFEFQASLQSPSLIARDGRLVYQVGIRLSGERFERRRVALFGTWKLHRDLSVSFEIPYADGRVQAIRFGGTYTLSPRDRIAAALHTSRGERLGLTVTFTRELVPDASLFLRVREDAEERSAIGGLQVRF